MAQGPNSAGRLETLGAWLHVWTPRRGVYVPPPPPRRKLVLWGVAIGVPLAAALAVGLTLLAHARDDQAARERRAAAAVEARELARLRAEQRPRHGRGRPVRLKAQPGRVLTERHALVHRLERAITADVHMRFRNGTIEDDVARTTCPPYTTVDPDNPPEPPIRAHVGKYDCLASVGSLRFGNNRVTNGYPFWARVHYDTGRFTWCKISRIAGEGQATGKVIEVPLARECDLARGPSR